MIQEAGQKHQLPEAVLDVATGKSKDSPTGGKALIDQDLANIEKIKRLGAGDFGLVTTEGGVQLQLPPTTVAERQADIDRQAQASQAELQNRTEQGRIQQEAQAQQLEQQRLSYEADLARIRQERAQAGQQHNILAEQRRTTAPLQRAVTQAQTNAELAKLKEAMEAKDKEWARRKKEGPVHVRFDEQEDQKNDVPASPVIPQKRVSAPMCSYGPGRPRALRLRAGLRRGRQLE
jgi:multidrug efflux pump subunit AcrA (membrane-fusion protein)